MDTSKAIRFAKSFWSILKETYQEWKDDKVSRLAAALAYYTLFSLTPLLIITIAIAGLLFGQQTAQDEILTQVDEMVGADGAEMISTMIQNANRQLSGEIAALIGFVTLLVGATGVFGQLQDSLNIIWDVESRPGRSGIVNYITKRLISFGMVVATGFLLLVSLVISAALAALSNYMSEAIPEWQLFANVLDYVISFVIITLLFELLYVFVPDVKTSWKHVLPGAIVTAVLFTVGKSLIGLYLGRSGVTSAYGAAGSLIIILLWIYYSAQVIFFGAEFAQVYALRVQGPVEPEDFAVKLPDEKVRRANDVPVKVGKTAAVTTAETASAHQRNTELAPRFKPLRFIVAAITMNAILVLGVLLRKFGNHPAPERRD